MKKNQLVFALVYFVSIALMLTGSSCNRSKTTQFEIQNFKAVTNFASTTEKNKAIALDYTEAIDSGFIIPTVRQFKDGKFSFEFSIKNKTGKAQKFFYKLYYQNESYKFPEFVVVNNEKYQHPFAGENFYGSWENPSVAFLETAEIPNDGEFHTISFNLRIAGNPRNEERFFGSPDLSKLINEKTIADRINGIQSSPEWLASVKKKAIENKRSLNEQLRLDAIFVIGMDNEKTKLNQRWKRNPRVGNYSFMLVVTTEENIKDSLIDDHALDISKSIAGEFMNPYYYFLYGKGASIKETETIMADSILCVKAQPDLSKGIYIDPKSISEYNIPKTAYNNLCNNTEKLYKEACFAQFFHSYDKKESFKNVNKTEDLTKITKEEYLLLAKTAEKSMINTARKITDCACKTVSYDSTSKSLTIFNPGNVKQKESVGVITRHGFTYGKYTIKVKLTELMNKSNVWNGITNAIWMINQDNNPWNNRRDCFKGGYIPKYDDSQNDKMRQKRNSYSEIDFEILKTSKNWPVFSYKNKKMRVNETAVDEPNIIVTCTNWDLACQDPKKFDVGVRYIQYKNFIFEVHRWHHWYKALTSKYSANEDDLFARDYYYFQIEWKPTEIIWRIGPEKGKLRVVGYMNDLVTSIPNNQMFMIVTQEFHLSQWWPESQFIQNYIPFPLKDLQGKIFSLEIE
ncbi:MAG: hypothetical protein V2A54_12260 [Bacteroidota bacterium]